MRVVGRCIFLFLAVRGRMRQITPVSPALCPPTLSSAAWAVGHALRARDAAESLHDDGCWFSRLRTQYLVPEIRQQLDRSAVAHMRRCGLCHGRDTGHHPTHVPAVRCTRRRRSGVARDGGFTVSSGGEDKG